jgi:N utilization substance protein B
MSRSETGRPESNRAEMRRGARLSVVQALYEMEIGGRGVVEAMAEFEAFWIGKQVEDIELPKAEVAFFRDLLGGVVREQRLVDRSVDEALASGWPLKRIEAVVRAIFRAGAYELAFRKDVPARAVISEYVAVARAFYEGEEIGMVNAVLDKLAREFRADEFDAPAA